MDHFPGEVVIYIVSNPFHYNIFFLMLLYSVLVLFSMEALYDKLVINVSRTGFSVVAAVVLFKYPTESRTMYYKVDFQ